jgi:hypothetical protein
MFYNILFTGGSMKRIAFYLLALCFVTPLDAQWVELKDGLPADGYYVLATSGTKVFIGHTTTSTYSRDNGAGVFLSTNNGDSWAYAGLGGDIASLAIISSNVYATIWGSNISGSYISTNDGASWTAMNSPFVRFSSMAEIGNNVFAGTYGKGVFLSTNDGASWTAVNSGLTDTLVSALAVSGTNLFAGTLNSGIVLSTNEGTSWIPVNTGLTNTSIHALAVSPASGGSGTDLFAGTSGGGVFRSTNNGASWVQVNTGLTGYFVNTLAVSPASGGKIGTYLFAGTDSGGVFITTNNGSSWTAVSNGLPKAYYDSSKYDPIAALGVSGSNLFATGYSVWKRPLSEMITSVKKHSTELPSQFSLEQNYPNPFNPATVINYAVAAPSEVEGQKLNRRVRLSVFDLLGREVAVLVNEPKQMGRYSVTWDASRCQSGVYFYRLSAGDYSQTRKLVILK